MENRSKTKVIFRNFEKERAQFFRNVAYFFFSVSGIPLMKIFLLEDIIQDYSGIRLGVMIITFVLGILSLSFSFDILEKLDRKETEEYY